MILTFENLCWSSVCVSVRTHVCVWFLPLLPPVYLWLLNVLQFFWKFYLEVLSGLRLKVDFSREFVCCCLISWRSHQPGNSSAHIFVLRFTRSPGTVNLDCRSHVRARSWWQIFRGDCLFHEVTRFEKSELLVVPWRQPYCLLCGERESESEVAQACLTLCNPMDYITLQAPPSMGFSRQEYWSELSFPSPGDLPDPGIEPRSPALQADALTSEPVGKPLLCGDTVPISGGGGKLLFQDTLLLSCGKVS